MISVTLHNDSLGVQLFAGCNMAELLRQQPRGAMRFRLVAAGPAAGELAVEGGTVVSAQGVRVLKPPPAPSPEGLALAKARRRAAEADALARMLASDPWPTLLVGHSVTVRRAATVAWLRSTPVEQWPPIKVGLAADGTPFVTDGNHRIAVARGLGVRELPAVVRAAGRVVYEGLVGV